jgi:hypothetical protein
MFITGEYKINLFTQDWPLEARKTINYLVFDSSTPIR